jgi:hypothetical protein
MMNKLLIVMAMLIFQTGADHNAIEKNGKG